MRLTDRQYRLLRILAGGEPTGWTAQRLAQLTEAERAGAAQTTASLVRHGLAAPVGDDRPVRYRITPAGMQQLAAIPPASARRIGWGRR